MQKYSAIKVHSSHGGVGVDLDELEEELNGDHAFEADIGGSGGLHDVNLDSTNADHSSSPGNVSKKRKGDMDRGTGRDSEGIEMSSFPSGSSSGGGGEGGGGGGGEGEGGDGDGDREESIIDTLFKRDHLYRTATESWWQYLLRLLPRLFGIATFSWLKTLLEVGNVRRLEPEDLLRLSKRDSSLTVYRTFAEQWKTQLDKDALRRSCSNADIRRKLPKPSLAIAFISAFGGPFFAAGGLKFIHDSLLFVGPFLLNRLIKFLGDPSQPRSNGLWMVAALFVTQATMSLCLRQYFWWCYRVGMRLRSAVVVSVFVKSTCLSVGALARRNTGEITNLMAVDSTRLQDLTPYLHAFWYSLYQMSIALYFLHNQLGVASLAGVVVIVMGIPMTSSVAVRLKTIQKVVSKLRDERVKLSNEVLAGMKVIKLQAWEEQYQARINVLRDKELAELKKYTVTQALSGTLFTVIPLLVTIVSFMAYIYLGNSLDVATALTSLALFDLLRFPLAMLPNVLNNLVEAKVSVDRVQDFLLEPEYEAVGTGNLTSTGINVDKATLMWEGAGRKRLLPAAQAKLLSAEDVGSSGNFFTCGWDSLKCTPCIQWVSACAPCVIWRAWFPLSHRGPTGNIGSLAGSRNVANPLLGASNPNADASTSGTIADSRAEADGVWVDYSAAEYEQIIAKSMAADADKRIAELETTVRRLHGQATLGQPPNRSNSSSASMSRSSSGLPSRNSSSADMWLEGGGGGKQGERVAAANSSTERDERDDLVDIHEREGVEEEEGAATSVASPSALAPEAPAAATAAARTEKGSQRILALFRVSLQLRSNSLVAVIGAVGSGKSSLINAILGDMRLCFGSLAKRGTVAYLAQRPFISNSSLRENILFGLPYDADRYQQTIFECALVPDLAVLPGGDMTEIGERGINLSGGQKTRVALARAVYADTDIYLLDDPLAAVDAHVGAHIFEHCILKLRARGKCTLLVTNALHMLRKCSRVVCMQDGTIADAGHYDELIHTSAVLKEAVRSYNESSEVVSNASAANSGGDVLLPAAGEQPATPSDGGGVAVPLPPPPPGSPSPAVSHKTVFSGSGVSVSGAKSVSGAIGGSTDPAKPVAPVGQLTGTEEREIGDVSLKVYMTWAEAAGGTRMAIIMGFLFIACEFAVVLSSWWLSYWSEHSTGVNHQWYYLGVYALISLLVAFLMFSKEIMLRLQAWHAGQLLFRELLHGVLYAPMSFFDTTPLGRILNRFSKDTYTADEQLPQTVRWYLASMSRVFGVVIYICFVTPMFMLGLLPITFFYRAAQKYYIKTSRELARLDSISRSPIYALFSEVLDGLPTIRAFNCELRLIKKNCQLLDTNQRAYFLNFSCNCWLGVRLELVGTMLITFASLFAVLGRAGSVDDGQAIGQGVTKGSAFAALAGLSISLALSVTQSLNWSVRMASDLESQMVSVERLTEYAKMPQEAPHVVQDNSTAVNAATGQPMLRVPSSWPSTGTLKFNNVTMRYRSDTPVVLNGVTFSIKNGEKIGIVGRTGSGKSSLVTALLRLVELESGSIEIDGLDASRVGLNALRAGMAVIAQDPVLFSGTLRNNLDPFQLFSDSQLWEGLRRAQINSAFDSLDAKVEENGSNYSVGQRQLICIARALLSGSHIIIMDEATAAVDVETDAMIQRSFREDFKSATCLTIAHRLNTIMDSDRVLVMDDGKVAELASPSELLQNENSLFRKLVDRWDESNNGNNDQS